MLSALFITLMLTGCGWPPKKPEPPVQTKSQTELAVQEIKGEWLKTCDGLAEVPPGNSTGNLLLDYTDAVALLGICLARHNSLIEYLAPVVARERNASP